MRFSVWNVQFLGGGESQVSLFRVCSKREIESNLETLFFKIRHDAYGFELGLYTLMGLRMYWRRVRRGAVNNLITGECWPLRILRFFSRVIQNYDRMAHHSSRSSYNSTIYCHVHACLRFTRNKLTQAKCNSTGTERNPIRVGWIVVVRKVVQVSATKSVV